MRELLRRIDSRELQEWQAYYELEPFGEERGDLRAGIVAATVANANRNPKKTKPFKPGDFMVDYEKLVTSQSGNQSTLAKEPGQAREEDPVERGNRLLGMVEILNEAFGGQDLREKRVENRE